MTVLRASSWGTFLADISKTCDLCTSRLMPELCVCVCVCLCVCVCVCVCVCAGSVFPTGSGSQVLLHRNKHTNYERSEIRDEIKDSVQP
jgi:hypothetical protein